jgi:hypothetical protein
VHHRDLRAAVGLEAGRQLQRLPGVRRAVDPDNDPPDLARAAPHDEHRAGGPPHYAARHAAHKHAPEGTVTAPADHDDVGGEATGFAQTPSTGGRPGCSDSGQRRARTRRTLATTRPDPSARAARTGSGLARSQPDGEAISARTLVPRGHGNPSAVMRAARAEADPSVAIRTRNTPRSTIAPVVPS